VARCGVDDDLIPEIEIVASVSLKSNVIVSTPPPASMRSLPDCGRKIIVAGGAGERGHELRDVDGDRLGIGQAAIRARTCTTYCYRVGVRPGWQSPALS